MISQKMTFLDDFQQSGYMSGRSPSEIAQSNYAFWAEYSILFLLYPAVFQRMEKGTAKSNHQDSIQLFFGGDGGHSPAG